jgi:hypothetical protein
MDENSRDFDFKKALLKIPLTQNECSGIIFLAQMDSE